MSQSKSELEYVLVRSGLAEFTRDIRLGKFERSYEVAKRTVTILAKLIKENRWSSAKDLINCLKDVCTYIDSLNLVETAAGNITRRVMRIIRDECYSSDQRDTNQDLGQETFDTSRDEVNDNNLNLDIELTGIMENILEGVEELTNELDLSSRSIAQQAVDYVQSDDVILTLGESKVIKSFLRHAAIGSKTGTRKFNVIVVELAPFYSGREMAKSLTKNGISTLIIPDSAVFAIMSRVNKVIISCHSMMANGGIKAPAGSHSIALAAKHYSVPLIVCCPMYKLTPEYLVSHDSVAFNRFSNLHAAFPDPYISKPSQQCDSQNNDDSEDENNEDQSSRPFEEIECERIYGQRGKLEDSSEKQYEPEPSNIIEALHSIFDYVPPELITLFVSNIGGNSPSYVYQLLNELYCRSDYLD